MQPSSAPFGTGAKLPLIDDAKYPNIGDRLSAEACRWNWYSGGWDDAAAGHPGPLFQYHHQPFNYFTNYAPGTARPRPPAGRDGRSSPPPGRARCRPVSFVKPYGAENEHPGYASEPDGSDHLVDLLKAATTGPQAKDTLVVVTYDEFGGQWDHVAPPGAGHAHPGRPRRLGPRHPHPGAAGPRSIAVLGRGPHGLRHYLDHGDDRAQLGAEARRDRDAQVSDLGRAVRIGSD